MKVSTLAVIALSLFPLAAFSQTNTFPSSGNVGIGTLSPAGILETKAFGNDTYISSPGSSGYARMFVRNDTGLGFELLSYGSTFAGTSSFGPPNANLSLILGTLSNAMVIGNNGPYPVIISNFGADRIHVDPSGNVGIGSATPANKLDVVGNVHFTGSATVDGNIAAKYQDVAEWVESSQELPAGTVVILDASKSNHVIASTQSYDSRVAGVISLKPGLTLGEEGEGRVLVATTGRVKVKVDATNGPVQIGDLLVTSDHEGFAMKSLPIEIGGARMHRPGTLIGKALEPLQSGTGEILVLLSLQ